MRILLASANDSVRTRWQHFLNGQKYIEQAASTADVLSSMASNPSHLVLLHRLLADIPTCSQIHRLAPECKIFILSDFPDADEGVEFLKAGAVGYGNTYISQTRLFEALHVITSANGIWIGQKVVQKLIMETSAAVEERKGVEQDLDAKLSVLTPMEKTVARLVARGMTNLEIAAELKIAERTVKAHLSAIYDKMHVANRLSLALLVNQSGNGK